MLASPEAAGAPLPITLINRVIRHSYALATINIIVLREIQFIAMRASPPGEKRSAARRRTTITTMIATAMMKSWRGVNLLSIARLGNRARIMHHVPRPSLLFREISVS